MLLERIEPFEIHDSLDGYVGRATNGSSKKTASIQVREYVSGGYMMQLQVRYKVGNKVSRDNAVKKAREWAVDYYKE